MKSCNSCKKAFDSTNWECPSCGYVPQVADGCLLFAPELAIQNGGFDPADFQMLSVLEKKHFWFLSRNNLIGWAINHYFSRARSFFEVGCGTGFVLSTIRRKFPALTISGSDIYSAALTYSRREAANINLFQMNASCIPFEDEFDVVGAFDVIEHVEDDTVVLSQIFKSLKNRGGIILTVPQHPFLWGKDDENACHKRRYTKGNLVAKVVQAGFTIERVSSFVSLLFPLLWFSRRKTRNSIETFDPLAELKIGTFLNFSLKIVMNIERVLIQLGISFPFGGSLLLIAYKQ